MEWLNLDFLSETFDNDKAELKELLSLFLIEFRVDNVRLEKAIESKKWHETARISHKLKGAISVLSNETLINTINQISKSAKDSNSEQVICSFQKYQNICPVLEAEISQVLKELL